MIVGEVAGTTLAETGEIRSLTVDVDSETFTISLRSQGMAGSVEVNQENVAGMGDVVILSRPFSCSLSMPTIHYDDSVPTSPVSQPQGQAMPRLRLSDFIRFQLLYHLRQKTKPLAEFGPSSVRADAYRIRKNIHQLHRMIDSDRSFIQHVLFRRPKTP